MRSRGALRYETPSLPSAFPQLGPIATLFHFLYGPSSRLFTSFAAFAKYLSEGHASGADPDPAMREHIAQQLTWFRTLHEYRDYVTHFGSIDISFYEPQEGVVRTYLQDALEVHEVVAPVPSGLDSFCEFVDGHFAARITGRWSFRPSHVMRSGDWPVLHPSLGSMHNRAVFLACVVLLIGEGSCASPPLWKMPPGLSSGSRVRVVSPRLGSAWQPGRTLLSTNGCWIVQAAVTHDPKAITVLTPRQVTRLQVSEAVPPPDWWAVPEDAEGWSELLPGVLEEASTPKCRGGDSSTGTM